MNEPSTSNAVGRYVTDVITPLKDRVAILPGSRDRQLRPVIFFPSRETSANADDLRNLLGYFYSVTSDKARKNGFIFIIGTRKGTTWQSVKPILRGIQESFSGVVGCVYVIKPDNFFKSTFKHKISSAPAKYKFDVQYISIEHLTKLVDASQLLKEFNGALVYDAEEWIATRHEVERVVQRLSQALTDCENYRHAMQHRLLRGENGIASNGIAGLGVVDELEIRFGEISIRSLNEDVHHLQQRIMASAGAVGGTPNPDLAAILPHVTRLAAEIRKTKDSLARETQEHKLEADKQKQLASFEMNVRKFKDQLESKFSVIDQRFSVIGATAEETKRHLREQEVFFETNTDGYNYIASLGRSLIESDHVASPQIENLLKQHKDTWAFVNARLQQRTEILRTALAFRVKTEEYFANLPAWERVLATNNVDLSRSLGDLQDVEKEFREYDESIELAYSEAYNEAQNLTQLMIRCYGNERVGQVDSYKTVLEVIQNLIRSKRRVHDSYEPIKTQLEQRMSFLAFMSESESVLEWLNKHGEPYLRKKYGIGQATAEARSLKKQHEQFQTIAFNTHRNAQQLVHVAELLIKGGGQSASELAVVKQRYVELQTGVKGFRERAEQRAELLALSIIFHIHHGEIVNWYNELNSRVHDYELVGESGEAYDRLREKFVNETQATSDAFEKVLSESKQLQNLLDVQRASLGVENEASKKHIEELTAEIQTRHNQEMERWPYERSCLKIGQRVRMHLIEAQDSCVQLSSWRDDLRGLLHENTQKYHILYPAHLENVKQVNEVSTDLKNYFAELLAVIEENNLRLLNPVDGRPIVEVLRESQANFCALEAEVMQKAEDVTSKIVLCRDIHHHLKKATDVVRSIEGEITTLKRLMRAVPDSKHDVQKMHTDLKQLKKHYEQCAPQFEHTYELIRNFAPACEGEQRQIVMRKSDDLLQKWEIYQNMISACQKLANSAHNYYNYNETILSVIRQFLDQDPNERHDFCEDDQSGNDSNKAHNIANVITKEAATREKFMQGTLYMLKITDNFIKALRNCPGNPEYFKPKEQIILEYKRYLKEKQPEVLGILNNKKKRIEQCQKTVFLRAAAADLFSWLRSEPASKILNPTASIAELKQKKREEIDEHANNFNDFKSVVKAKRMSVKEFYRHVDTYFESVVTDMHTAEIRELHQRVRDAFDTFFEAFHTYSRLLAAVRGGDESGASTTSEETSEQRLSDCNIEDKMNQTDDQKADSQMRRPMFELIDGEKKYIDVLATTIDVYLTDYIRANAEASLPQALRGKEAAIFGNIRKLFHFHKDVFINDLISYTDNPTLIGCAFVNNIDRLRELYTEYIVNKEQNDQLVHSPEVVRFFEEVRARHPVIARLEAERNVALKLDSVLMWPVQRLFKYGLLLKRLIELAPYEIAEIRDVAESVGAITTYANDYIKLLAFEDFRNHQITEFVMTDEFIVTEPKRMFKREKDYQVFLFENNLILAKKERDETGTHYCFKDRIMLNDVYVVEHVDSSNIKFGLRRQSPSTSATTDNTFIFRADSERTQQRWVKTLRNLMAPFVGLPGKKSSTSLGGASLGFSDNSASPVSSNRNSRASRDSYDFVGAAGATENTAPLNSNNNKAFQLSNVGVGVGDPPPSPHCP